MAQDLAIRTEGLRKQYGELTALAGLDLELPAGQVFALLGPNGAGKTTAVEILEGLRRASGGRAEVLGHDVDREYEAVRSRIGVLPQSFEPFDRLTPLESVAYWADLFGVTLGRGEAGELLDRVSLGERAKVLARKLSGGEKRKLGLAMSFVSRPELLFLDEPTTGLDPKARREIWSLLEAVRGEGRTVFLTTHYLDEAERLADDVGILHRGRLVARGAPEALVSRFSTQTTVVLTGAGARGLAEVEGLGFSATQQNGDVLVRVSDPHAMRATMAALAGLAAPYESLHTRRGSLEDVFLTLVGARMEEGVLAG